MYSVKGFLEKNKDVQQEMFFDAMESSKSTFVRELANFRVSTNNGFEAELVNDYFVCCNRIF